MGVVTGSLQKMAVRAATPVEYTLRLDGEHLPLNPHLGERLRLAWTGEIHCRACGRKTARSFSQGYCFPCSQRLAQCDICIVRPERCHYHQGTCREPRWGEAHCMQPHYVYLANASGLKVGITRASQIPTRWIDQGASQGLCVLRVASRHQSGLLEVLFKHHVADRTDWRRMLKGVPEGLDLAGRRDALLAECGEAVARLRDELGEDAIQAAEDAAVVTLEYPVLAYPGKVTALSLEKTKLVEGTLLGIKGQYLILDSKILNVRKYTGYRVQVTV